MNGILTISPDSLLGFFSKLKATKIQIITSCTSKKSVLGDNTLTWADFEKGLEWVPKREQENLTMPAKDLYCGRQHLALIAGLSEHPGFEFDLRIVSAGYGLISGDRPIAPHDATFSELPSQELASRAQHLDLEVDFRAALQETDADMTLVLLGPDYLKAVMTGSPLFAEVPTVFIGGNLNDTNVAGSNLFHIPLRNEHAASFGAGQTWLKAVVTTMILDHLNGDQKRECA
ncbi:hypothetical protein AWH63_10120 [Marinobacter sp. C18]|uniref:hypothetical protein n=1 Tax=Marinobacter sp. C18 TaxID=1772288 RepID=UPI0009488C38|nr:hypothetical protein [Marinobacter sp. C18]OLF81890.1 hypothetical protein AWH63_10120 [Marinobacter sp. C18]